MTKIIKIDSCRDCQYHCWREDLEKDVCTYKRCLKEVNLFDKIPDWCELEDYKDEKN